MYQRYVTDMPKAFLIAKSAELYVIDKECLCDW